MYKKRYQAVLAAFSMILLLTGASSGMAAPAEPPDRSMTVFKSPTCGCCAAWAELMTKAGFQVEIRDIEDMDVLKKMAAIPEPYWACHSAKLGAFIIEGHVPLAAIEKLLRETPDIRGIAVPGMPMGAPGMGGDPEASYDVLAILDTAEDGKSVYMRMGE